MVNLAQRFILTMDEVKHYLDLESSFTLDDDLLSGMIAAVIEHANHYLNRDWAERAVPSTVPLACLKAIHDWYYEKGSTTKQERRANITVTYGLPGEVQWSFNRMLWPHRKLPGS